jgi:low temperature requirement protein LtrA
VGRPRTCGRGATTFELFFDLVYVFAVTQITGLMTHEHGANGNQTRAGRAGGVRLRALPLIAGVVIAAVGVEGALQLADKREPVGAFYGLCLIGGAMLYLTGHLIFDRRVLRAKNIARIGTLLVLAALSPAIVLLPALAALASVTSVLAALVVFERVRFADLRQRYRDG